MRKMQIVKTGLAGPALLVALVMLSVAAFGTDTATRSALDAAAGQDVLDNADGHACLKRAGKHPDARQCFTSLGPDHFAGRVRALVVRPDDQNTIWAATPGGGLWHTNDAGNSWSHSSDGFQTLIYSSLAIDSSNPDVMFAGSGEIQRSLPATSQAAIGDGLQLNGAHRGFGILKTTDGGTNWTRLTNTLKPDFFYVSRIAVLPPQNAQQVVLAATGTGLWQSTDGGGSWALATHPVTISGRLIRVPIRGIFLDVKSHSHNPSNIVATGILGNVWFSTDGGASFFPSALPPQPSDIRSGTPSRIELAPVRSQPGVWLAAQIFDNNGDEGVIVVLRSTDGGAHFSNWSNPAIITFQGDDTTGRPVVLCGNNRFHSGALFVTDFGTNVFVGGTQLCESDDAGVTFRPVFGSDIHNDYHSIVRGGTDSLGDGTILIGNDGGIFRILDPSRLGSLSFFDSPVVNLNNGLVNQQFYGAATNPSGIIVGSAQDIGSLHRGADGTWTELIGGPAGSDGTSVAADPIASDLFYYGKSVARLYRNTLFGSECIAGANFAFPLDEMLADVPGCSPPGVTGSCPNQTVILLDPNDATANTLYVGCRQLWRTKNVKSANTSIVWCPIKDTVSGFQINAMGLRPGNPDVMYVGMGNIPGLAPAGELWETTNLRSGCDPSGPTWTQISALAANLPPRPISGIAVDPETSAVILVSFSGWPSTDFNETPSHNLFRGEVVSGGLFAFADISAGLPPGPVYSVAESFGGRIAAGTEFGARISNDGGSTWALAGPRAEIAQVQWIDEHHLLVTSYGRGVYVLSI